MDILKGIAMLENGLDILHMGMRNGNSLSCCLEANGPTFEEIYQRSKKNAENIRKYLKNTLPEAIGS